MLSVRPGVLCEARNPGGSIGCIDESGWLQRLQDQEEQVRVERQKQEESGWLQRLQDLEEQLRTELQRQEESSLLRQRAGLNHDRETRLHQPISEGPRPAPRPSRDRQEAWEDMIRWEAEVAQVLEEVGHDQAERPQAQTRPSSEESEESGHHRTRGSQEEPSAGVQRTNRGSRREKSRSEDELNFLRDQISSDSE